MPDPNNPLKSQLNSLLGRLDQDRFGDLLGQFGPSGPPTDENLRRLTNSSKKDFDAAGHDFRNDSGIRPPKPYSNDF